MRCARQPHTVKTTEPSRDDQPTTEDGQSTVSLDVAPFARANRGDGLAAASVLQRWASKQRAVRGKFGTTETVFSDTISRAFSFRLGQAAAAVWSTVLANAESGMRVYQDAKMRDRPYPRWQESLDVEAVRQAPRSPFDSPERRGR
jgi:hypothetical protein